MRTIRISFLLILLASSLAATAGAACVGDCTVDGMVTMNEASLCADIARGGRELAFCIPCDANGDGMVSESEVLQAMQNVENGCPAAATPTRTRTKTSVPGTTPTATPSRTPTLPPS